MQNSLEKEGTEALWYTKALILKSKKSIKEFFMIFYKPDQSLLNMPIINEQQLQLNFQQFEKLIRTGNPQINPQVIGYLFNLADFNQNGQVSLLGFQQLIEIINMEKDKPLKLRGKEISKQNYITMIKKLAILKENHQLGKINMKNIVTDLPIVCTHKQFFQYIQQTWNLQFLDFECIELTKILDKDFKKQIEPMKFLIFMGIQYTIPKPPQPKQNFHQINNNKILQQTQQLQQQGKIQNKCIDQYKSLLNNVNWISRQEEVIDIEKYKSLAQKVFNQQNKFTDPDFQANNQSLNLEKKQNYRWLRPEDFFGGNYSLFQKMDNVIIQSRIGLSGGWGEYITPYDIIQGELGDCYFLSSLSGLAVIPERILNLFVQLETNQQGLYCVKMCYNGEWKAVWIDDQFPCHKSYSEPAFTKGNGNELWVLILEKAWAKLWGSYGVIEAGLCREALRALTGAPTETKRCFNKNHDTGEYDKNLELPQFIEYCLNQQNQFIVTAGSQSTNERGLTQSVINNHGLVPGHAYSIIKVLKIEHPKLGQVRLLKMRNPWGKKEWKGKWSYNSELWTESIVKQYHINLKKDDGIFYMAMEDFYIYFNDIEVCFWHDKYIYNTFNVKSQKHKSQYITVQVQKSGEYYFTINQNSVRMYKEKYSNYEYSSARLIIIKLGQHQQFIGSKQKQDSETCIQTHLDQGETYLLICKVDWLFFQESNFVLSSYGVSNVKFALVDKNPFKNILNEVMLPRILIEFSDQIKQYKENPQIEKCYEFLIKEGLGFYYVKNNSDKLFESTINFTTLKGLKLRKPHRGQQLEICLPPKEGFICVFTVGNNGYSFQIKESYFLKNC